MALRQDGGDSGFGLDSDIDHNDPGASCIGSLCTIVNLGLEGGHEKAQKL